MRPEAAEVTPEVPARVRRLSRRPPRAQTRLVDAFRLSFTVVIGRLSTSGPPIQLAGLRSQEPRWWRLDIPTTTQDRKQLAPKWCCFVLRSIMVSCARTTDEQHLPRGQRMWGPCEGVRLGLARPFWERVACNRILQPNSRLPSPIRRYYPIPVFRRLGHKIEKKQSFTVRISSHCCAA